MTIRQFKVDGRHKVNRNQNGNFKIGVKCFDTWRLRNAATAILGPSCEHTLRWADNRATIAKAGWTHSPWDEKRDNQAVFFKTQEDVDKVLTYFGLIR